MEDFKIEHFIKDNPTKQFPKLYPLNPKEIELICQKLAKSLEISPDEHDLLLSIANQKSILLQDINANDDEFILFDVLSHLSIYPNENVYINWDRYDHIDEIKCDDLNNYFSYIWYPAVDDIDIFDSSFLWILSISHEGYIKYIKL